MHDVPPIPPKSPAPEPGKIARSMKWSLFGLWFAVKISIYLLVFYAVAFTLACSAGAVWAYMEMNKVVESVQELKDHQPQYSAFMKPFVRVVNGDTVSPLQHHYVPMDSISEDLKWSVLAAEDDMFYLHPGFNLEAILLALQKNKKHGKQAYGASTITQQLAKNMFLSTEKTWTRKAREFGYTLMLERYLGKDRILELYLNFAQWGPAVFGCEAAAEKYYKVHCADLSLRQSVNLAAMLAAPNRFMNPEAKGDKLLSARRRMIYDNLYYAGHLDLPSYRQLTGFKKPVPKDSLDPIAADSSQILPDSLAPSNRILSSSSAVPISFAAGVH